MDIYERHIVEILIDAGNRGLRVGQIVRYVFNAANSMFEPADIADVRRYVHNYVRRNSRHSDSILAHGTKRGVYKLNKKSEKAHAVISQVTGIPYVDTTDKGTPATDSNDLFAAFFHDEQA